MIGAKYFNSLIQLSSSTLTQTASYSLLHLYNLYTFLPPFFMHFPQKNGDWFQCQFISLIHYIFSVSRKLRAVTSRTSVWVQSKEGYFVLYTLLWHFLIVFHQKGKKCAFIIFILFHWIVKFPNINQSETGISDNYGIPFAQ